MKLLISVQADPDLRRDVNVLHNLLHKVFLQARVKVSEQRVTFCVLPSLYCLQHML